MKIQSLSIIAAIMVPLFVVSCNKSAAVNNLRLKGLTLQIRPLPNASGDDNTLSYAARLIPNKELLSNNGIRTKMQYQMDSTFYIQSGTEKIFANLVQPVANGVSGTFEYLVSFDRVDKGGVRLIYQDKYINHQKYTFNLD